MHENLVQTNSRLAVLVLVLDMRPGAPFCFSKGKGKARDRVLTWRYFHGRPRTARYAISKVAVDWQEAMALQLHPLPALTDIGPAVADSKHTTAPINHTRPSFRKHSPDGTTPSEVADIRLQLTTHLSTPEG